MKIKLNEKTTIDLPKLIESRLLIQANSGGGKSWAIRRLIEQSFGEVQINVIDPEGEFGNLREKFDFVYAGKDGDAPVEPRSASLLARRLLELKASAIVDLYELPPQERKHFVRLFCETMINAPKELWHDVLIIIDEAHVFAPEKGESEAMAPVIDLATRGRKRGYCVVLATQRLPKLNKDAAAECNNKLIGRASQDIDRKRAAEELGFTTKEQILSLRDLNPGEFYCFGPAISRDIARIVIGDVTVKPQKRGLSHKRVPAPSVKVKEILSKLADLPKEAEEEIKTIQSLKTELSRTKRDLQVLKTKQVEPVLPPVAIIEKAIKHAFSKKQDDDLVWEKRMIAENDRLRRALGDVIISAKKILDVKAPSIEEKQTLKSISEYIDSRFLMKKVVPQKATVELIQYHEKPKQNWEIRVNDVEMSMGDGERKILIALASYPEGMTREHITVQTGYKRSTRDAYIQRLLKRGYIGYGFKNGNIVAMNKGVEALGSDYEPLPTGPDLLEYHLKNLPEGEAKILRYLRDYAGGRSDGRSPTRDEISEFTGFKRSTRDAYIQRLMTRQLVTEPSRGSVAISEHLL